MARKMTIRVLLLLAATCICNALTADQKIQKLEATVGTLARQLMLQQFFLEERIRSDGDSGLKHIRHTREGTRPYHSNAYTSGSIGAIHDHSNNVRTVGMGELVVVLNGVEFRTRHNDYNMRMPHRTSKTYHATENIPLPEVPPAVTDKQTVQEQVNEMRQWFKAWRDGNYKTRDYRKYFKPVLCYMEGAWHADTTKLEEPFFSDRHQIDAASWFDLQEKIRFSAFSGKKQNNENHAFLPTTILDVVNGTPIYAQWNYRILCHPISRDIPLSRFRVIDDLANRMAYRRTLDVHRTARTARFQLNPFDKDTWYSERYTGYSLLDKLMEEIPGKDNYVGKLVDDAMFNTAQSMATGNPVMNTARYHRYYKSAQKGAMGVNVRHRGFSDENLFAAMTTQPKIGSMKYSACEYIQGKRQCQSWVQRWSYAIPLEIVYLTPLMSWNPYKLQYHRNNKIPTTSGRYGDTKNPSKAYNGTSVTVYYMTPQEFFTGVEVAKDAADTTKDSVGVLDEKNALRLVRASGTRTFLPNIPGVGVLRTRYPIMPIHQDGDAVMKELQALKDIVMRQQTYSTMLDEAPVSPTFEPGKPLKSAAIFEMSVAYQSGEHRHSVTVQPEVMERMIQGDEERLGCFIDDAKSRHLPYHVKNDSLLTQQRCKDHCRKKNFQLAGVENGHMCYCGWNGNYKEDKKVGDGECKAPCAADKSKTCGGAMRLEIYKLGIGCGYFNLIRPAGNLNPNADGLTASSVWKDDPNYAATNGFLWGSRGAGAWIPKTADTKQWIQMDLGEKYRHYAITDVRTQGRSSKTIKQWVTKYRLGYSDDGKTWTSYNNGEVLVGNSDNNTIKRQILLGFFARYVRLYPVEWVGNIALRWELFTRFCGERPTVDTSLDNGHSHRLRLYYHMLTKKFYYDQCDGKWANCWDNHGREMLIQP